MFSNTITINTIDINAFKYLKNKKLKKKKTHLRPGWVLLGRGFIDKMLVLIFV